MTRRTPRRRATGALDEPLAARAETVLAAHAEALMQRFIELAMGGDKTCMTLLVERLLPLKRFAERPQSMPARAVRAADLRARELDQLDEAYGPLPETR